MLTEKTGGITAGGSTAGGSTAGGSTAPIGQAFYGSGDGTPAEWTCPPGVTSVCVVAIGGGQASRGAQWSVYAGSGGGLGWKNDIPVVPGDTYAIEVGKGGNGYDGSYHGQDSYFISPSTVKGGGATNTPGDYAGDGGGNGGTSGQYGGGGAGGYTGSGGDQNSNGAGGGGGGGGSYSSTYGGASGGGTGPWGQGVSGTSTSYSPGRGGSGGESGRIGENGWWSYGSFGDRRGGMFGGGGGGSGSNSSNGGGGMNQGGRGCVRIIWGEGRFFPSTGTGDM